MLERMTDTNRRGFLRILGSLVALLSGRASAAPVAKAPAIHRGTRNTRLGALGPRLPKGRPGPPYKQYPGKPIVVLPAPESSGRSLAEVVKAYRPASAFSGEALSLSQLGTLLHHTNGVTDSADPSQKIRRRAAPSAGALYSGEVYLVAEKVVGLEAGLYYYSVAEHRLVGLRKGSLLEELLGAVERPAALEGASAVVLLSNVFGRYSRRYANRGYRYALIDSGHIGENLRLVGSALGLADASPLRFFDDSLNRLLELDGRDEAVCALHAIGGKAAAGRAEPGSASQLFQDRQQIGSKGARIRGRSLTERFHEATKLLPTKTSASFPGDPSVSNGKPAVESAGATRLPTPSTSKMRVTTSIRRRRSARAFDALPLEQTDLSFVLRAAQGNPWLQRTSGVELDVVAHAVAGLDPGVYRYEPRSHRLLAIRTGSLRNEMVGACHGQERAGTAAVGLVMAARLDLDGTNSILGSRRYRDLLIECGAIAQRIYLSAEAVGLAARNLAAYQDDRFNELLGLESRGFAALHLTMLGPGD